MDWLAALLIALQSPLDVLAEHSFTMHQFQHMFLRAIGPMLLMLAAPQVLLIAGMPDWLRTRVLAPLLTSRVAGPLFGFFAHPFVAAGLQASASAMLWQNTRIRATPPTIMRRACNSNVP